MDAAVNIVETYLRVNGFFTVTEYPILVRGPDGRIREGTDIDMLATRLAGGGRVLPRPGLDGGRKLDIDPALGIDWTQNELILAEVKEGTADPNPAMFRKGVLRQALRRFGCVPRDQLGQACYHLTDTGVARWTGHRVRLLSFGSKQPHFDTPATYVSLGQCLHYLDEFVRHNREFGGQPRFRDPILAQIAIRQKTET